MGLGLSLPYINNVSSTTMSEVALPLTPRDFFNCFPGDTETKIFQACHNPGKLSDAQNAIWKYSGTSLRTGRPLNSAIIFLAGITGSGKSSTINALFNDPKLCSTSSCASETKIPILLQKKLEVVHPSQSQLKICGNLSFVDVPGTFDTDSKNEVVDLASIQKFCRCRMELAQRTELAKRTPKAAVNISEKVYPNLILFVLKATDNRMSGPDSFFRKSLDLLKSTADLIDVKNPNLIVVLTHIMAIPPLNFSLELNEKRKLIQGIVMDILGIKNVPVVPVENAADLYGLKKRGEFYVLPNGELSHHNLFQEMLHVFRKNNDLLGELLVGWYINSDGPERNRKATVIESHEELTTEELAMAGKCLKDKNIVVCPEHLATVYNFQSLGYGYCPVTEEVKPVCLINPGDESERKFVEIEDSKFLIPKCVTPFFDRTSSFRQLSFFEKEEYESHMQAAYGIEAGFKLVISGSSNGRWIQSPSSRLSSSVITAEHAIQYVTFKMDDPGSHITNSRFLDELHALPNKYNSETAKAFQSFFSKYGSHFIYEQAIGGDIRFLCTVENASVGRKQFQDIQASISGVYKVPETKKVSGTAGGNHTLETKNLKSVGVTKVEFQIDGGDPPAFVSVDTLTADDVEKWKKTVPRRPTELKKSIKLYPYYNLLDSGDQYNVLYEATKDYLRATLNERIKSAYEQTRSAASSASRVSDTTTPRVYQPARGGCFGEPEFPINFSDPFGFKFPNLIKIRNPPF